ncbi:hypothetical protein P7C70_g5187, partial [Phenoliferia sp. Uapishka_3]
MGVSYFVNAKQFSQHPIYQSTLDLNPSLQFSSTNEPGTAAYKQDLFRHITSPPPIAEGQNLPALRIPSNLSKFERGVERAWVMRLQNSCQQEINRRQQMLERERGFFGIGANWEKVKEITDARLENCEKIGQSEAMLWRGQQPNALVLIPPSLAGAAVGTSSGGAQASNLFFHSPSSSASLLPTSPHYSDRHLSTLFYSLSLSLTLFGDAVMHFLPLLASAALVAPSLVAAGVPKGYIDGVNNSTMLAKALKKPFDYIVVGGGNTGLAVASRLAEASKRVLVLEAGSHQTDNIEISIPGEAGSIFDSALDWAYYTEPQVNAHNRSVYWPRAKVLGGCSAMNFMVFTRAVKAEYDAWKSLGAGNGWTWSSLLPFFKKSESFNEPTGNSQNATVIYDSSVHGSEGPISSSYPPYMSPQGEAFAESLLALGLPQAQDLTNGADVGVSYASSAINPDGHSRVTSTAYLSAKALKHLVVATNCHATKINWAPEKRHGMAIADGITFVTGSGVEFVAHATKEVVLSAGSIGTPQLLEISGVGNPKIINPLGIKTVVNLPGVGENLQDHPAVVNVYKLKNGSVSLDTVQSTFGPAYSTNVASALEQYEAGSGLLTQELYTLAYLEGSNFLNASEEKQVQEMFALKNTGISPKQLAAIKGLYDGGAPIIEYLTINVFFGASSTEENCTYISLATCLQHSLSRGSTHITSSNHSVYPSIDPQYLQHPADRFFLSKGSQFARKAAHTYPLSEFIETEQEPGYAVQTEAQFEDWIEGDVRTEYHPIGTAAMLPIQDGGVVSPELVVYGTQNLRVADVSIMPIHLSAHAMSVACVLQSRFFAHFNVTNFHLKTPQTPSERRQPR